MNTVPASMSAAHVALVAAPVSLALIDVPTGRRRLDPRWVETLADEIGRDGLQTPIELVIEGGRFRLVAGHHRYAAAKLLGWADIPAFTRTLEEWSGENAIKLREITENLIRRELTALDRAFDIAAWREIYIATHDAARRGRPKKRTEEEEEKMSGEFATNFSEAAIAALGMDKSTVFKNLKIASIGQALRERISLLPIADNQSELLFLAREPADRRDAIVALLTAEPAQAATIADAIAIIDREPKPSAPQRWEKLSQGFSRLPQPQQEAFFHLHKEPILAWAKAQIAEEGK